MKGILYCLIFLICSICTYADVPTLESTTFSSSTQVTLTVNMPAIRPNGDLYIAIIQHDEGTSSVPGNWIPIYNQGGGYVTNTAWYWIGSGEPASYTYTITETGDTAGVVYRISGFDTSDKIHKNATNLGVSTNGLASSVTTEVDDCLILRSMGTYTYEVTATPATTDYKGDINGDMGYGFSHSTQSTAGATGVPAFTHSSTSWRSGTIAIAPEPNTDPILSGIPDKAVDEDINPDDNWIDLYTYASDGQDTDAELTFSIQSQTNSSLISCSVVGDQYINCTNPAADQSGYSDIVVRATDTGSLYNEDTFRVTVNAVNDPATITTPLFNNTAPSIIEDIKVNTTYSDVENDEGILYFGWYVNDINIFNDTINASVSLESVLLSGNFSFDDSINVSVYANDGTDNSTIAWSETITVVNAPPEITIVSPEDNFHYNQQLSINFTASDPEGSQINCSLYVNNTFNNSVLINSGDYSLINSSDVEDGTYDWYLSCSDGIDLTNTTTRSYTFDTIYPTIQWTYPLEDNSTIVADNFNVNIPTHDVHLFRALMNITNSLGAEAYSNYSGDINQEWYNFTDLMNISGWSSGYYTMEVSGTDDSTHGINTLLYSVDGVTFFNNTLPVTYTDRQNEVLTFKDLRSDNTLDLIIGSQYVSPADILTRFVLPVDITIQKYLNDWKFGFNVTKATGIPFNFVIKLVASESLKLRNPELGHFIYNDEDFIKFTDLIDMGFEITDVIIVDDKTAVLEFSPNAILADELFLAEDVYLDPVTGGLNTKTEYIQFLVDVDAPTLTNDLVSGDEVWRNAAMQIYIDAIDNHSGISTVTVTLKNPNDVYYSNLAMTLNSGDTYLRSFIPGTNGDWEVVNYTAIDVTGHITYYDSSITFSVVDPPPTQAGGDTGSSSLSIEDIAEKVIEDMEGEFAVGEGYLDYGRDSYTVMIKYLPVESYKEFVVTARNGTVNGQLSVSSNLKDYISAYICDPITKECSTNIQMKEGDIKILVIKGNYTEELDHIFDKYDSVEGMIKIESNRVSSLIISLDKAPLFSFAKRISNITSLSPVVAAFIVYAVVFIFSLFIIGLILTSLA